MKHGYLFFGYGLLISTFFIIIAGNDHYESLFLYDMAFLAGMSFIIICDYIINYSYNNTMYDVIYNCKKCKSDVYFDIKKGTTLKQYLKKNKCPRCGC